MAGPVGANVSFAEEDINEMVSLYLGGMTCRKIGEKFDVGEMAISRRLKRRGVEVTIRKYKHERVERWKTEWHFARAVIELDGGKCKLCNSAEELHVHHIIPRRMRPDLAYDPDNLITLCRSCHLQLFRDELSMTNALFELIDSPFRIEEHRKFYLLECLTHGIDRT